MPNMYIYIYIYIYIPKEWRTQALKQTMPIDGMTHEDLESRVAEAISSGNQYQSPFLHFSNSFNCCWKLSREPGRAHRYTGTIVCVSTEDTRNTRAPLVEYVRCNGTLITI
jgi:hypothetical protein